MNPNASFFCLWLDGYLTSIKTVNITVEQLEEIKENLKPVVEEMKLQSGLQKNFPGVNPSLINNPIFNLQG